MYFIVKTLHSIPKYKKKERKKKEETLKYTGLQRNQLYRIVTLPTDPLRGLET